MRRGDAGRSVLNLLGPKMKIFSCVATMLFLGGLGSILAIRDYNLRKRDIASSEQYSTKLKEVIAEIRESEDLKLDIDARKSWDFNWWKMQSNQNRINAHVKILKLKSVATRNIEENRLRSRIPYAWDQPSSDCVVWANPPGLLGCDDGESEYVMLLDRISGIIYVYSYLNF